MKCSHCLEDGHSKAAATCPLKGQDPAPRPEKKPASNRWTEEVCDQLKKLVYDRSSLKIDWEEIGTVLSHPASACETKYNELVTPEEQVRHNVALPTADSVRALMADSSWECSTCSHTFYNCGRIWRGQKECEPCFKIHLPEIDAMWARIDLIARMTCLFCDRHKSSGITFNFDHINMFDKGDAICTMVWRGDSYEDIIQEIVKCQVICTSCHAVVTAVERAVGFQKVKIKVTRSENGTSDRVLTEEEISTLYTEMRALYRSSIEPIYAVVRSIIQGKR